MERRCDRVKAAAALIWGLGLMASAPAVQAGHTVGEAQAWAMWVDDLARGPMDVAQPGLGLASWGLESDALDEAEADGYAVLSLGDGGFVTLEFETPISDGPGNDLAVFENGFFTEEGLFLELAFIEVSSNGLDFARFPALALQPLPVPGFGSVDPALYANLAGTHMAGIGTGFDLAELAGHPLTTGGLLDLSDVAFVRVTDVVGDGSTVDADGRPVYDPYPTIFFTGGFDLDGVAALNVPEPGLFSSLMAGLLLLTGLVRHRSRRGADYGRRALIFATAPCSLLLLLSGTAQAAYEVDFEDLGLGSESHWNGQDESGSFQSGPVFFENVYTTAWDSWHGFAASTHTDTTTPGFGNQYSAYPGTGASGSTSYGLFYDNSFEDARLILPESEVTEGMQITNTTYAALSMLNGDAFAKQFGGPSGDDPDWFKLTIHGYDDVGATTGSLDFYLADYRFSDNALDYLIDQWTWVDLTSLGDVKELGFALDSSDYTGGFMNTPAYFALDGLRVVPEPGTALLLGLGLLGLGLHGRR
jgi:hypothetical protein